METPETRHSSVRQLVWLSLLIYALIALFLLFAAPKAEAAVDQTEQAQLLDDLLGRLEYMDAGVFVAVDDVKLTEELAQLVTKYKLNGQHGSAWIRDSGSGQLVWSASDSPLEFDTSKLSDGYEMQFMASGGFSLAVQNFWLTRADDSRAEFRMVVALPLD